MKGSERKVIGAESVKKAAAVAVSAGRTGTEREVERPAPCGVVKARAESVG